MREGLEVGRSETQPGRGALEGGGTGREHKGAGGEGRGQRAGGQRTLRGLRGRAGGKGARAEGRGSAGYPEDWASPHRRGSPRVPAAGAGSTLSPTAIEEPPPPSAEIGRAHV